MCYTALLDATVALDFQVTVTSGRTLFTASAPLQMAPIYGSKHNGNSGKAQCSHDARIGRGTNDAPTCLTCSVILGNIVHAPLLYRKGKGAWVVGGHVEEASINRIIHKIVHGMVKNEN